MFTGLAQLFRASILFLGAALLMATYLLPSYPTTMSGWLWFLGASLPYAIVLGISASVLRRAIPPRDLRSVAAACIATAVLVASTVGFLFVAGVIT
jgi:hypothetical protein